ncbi:MAG: 1-deoxy-D-xylulose-5-phosphate reductoisomerase [Clostridia bacterium]|nr:1-deoxy-D-xylulose-5-phosphate reductoisomerase [Clostridia bacterium]
MKKVALIGSCGSIGMQVLEVVRRHPEEFEIVALATRSENLIFDSQVAEFRPRLAAAFTTDRYRAIAVAKCAEADIIFNAAGGFEGLEYSLAAVRAGKTLALANKESIICGGEILLPLARKKGVQIIPVDSEHSAIWQCLDFGQKPVRRLVITASGGPFKGQPREVLDKVTPEEALKHPTWKMGRKISIDSATLMNKGFEIIEAHGLFGVPYENIDAVIQPQSVVHSLVEFTDGSTLAQLSYPTMQVPIQLALSYPSRLDLAVQPIDYTQPFSLDFQPLVKEEYPCFALALECGQAGGVLPCALNAADEVAVAAFLEGRISFTDIFRVTESVVSKTRQTGVRSFTQLEETDAIARTLAKKIIDGL